MSRHTKHVSKIKKPAKASGGILTKEGCQGLDLPQSLQCKFVVKLGGEYLGHL